MLGLSKNAKKMPILAVQDVVKGVVCSGINLHGHLGAPSSGFSTQLVMSFCMWFRTRRSRVVVQMLNTVSHLFVPKIPQRPQQLWKWKVIFICENLLFHTFLF